MAAIGHRGRAQWTFEWGRIDTRFDNAIGDCHRWARLLHKAISRADRIPINRNKQIDKIFNKMLLRTLAGSIVSTEAAENTQQLQIERVPIYDIRYTQETISPTFTSSGTKLKAVIDKINRGELNASDFKKLKVIRLQLSNQGTLCSPEAIYFTLDNRTLYALKNSRLSDDLVDVIVVDREQLQQNVYKITSQNDGFHITISSQAKKDLDPPEGTLLAKVKKGILSLKCD